MITHDDCAWLATGHHSNFNHATEKPMPGK
jgi:hypothetical protein